ncbi:MAG: TrkA family potassium uptake protein, partial [Odoribacter sp.]|nr:TrkA family potassium uptake protein [Odoribacter sp.]
TVAILKQNGAKRIIVRAISVLHKTILEAMGITEIIQLEKEYAEFFATKTELTTSIYSYQVTPDYFIYELKLPAPFIGRKLTDIQLEKDFDLKLIAVKHYAIDEDKGYPKMELIETPDEDFVAGSNDVFVLFGKRNRFRALSRS